MSSDLPPVVMVQLEGWDGVGVMGGGADRPVLDVFEVSTDLIVVLSWLIGSVKGKHVRD